MSDIGYVGPYDSRSAATEYEQQAFLIRTILAKMATSTLVKVIAVYPGGLSGFSTADVQPMVNMIDGQGNSTPHGVIHGLPVFRLQGGASAVILDPAVGDIGWAGFCSTDISSVVATQKVANPGSRRMFDWADGVYFGGVLGEVPTQFIEFAPGVITIAAAVVNVIGVLQVDGVPVIVP